MRTHRPRRSVITLVLFFTLTLLSVIASADSAVVRGGHPRVYITPETVPEVQRRCREEYRPLYDRFKTASWILNQEPGVGNSHMTNMVFPAFLYVVEGESRYADTAKRYLDALSENPPHDQYLSPEYVRQAAVCYDWIFDTLSDEEKSRYTAAFVDLGDYILSLWRHSDFNNHFVNETLSVLYIGVVLHGDGVDDEAARRFLDIGTTYLKDHAIPAANEIAGEHGGQAEGFSYNDWGHARPLAHTVEMWRTATGEDLFADSSFFKSQALWHLYCLRPHDGTFVKAEDCPSGLRPGENLKSFIHLVGARCQDGYAQWLGDRIDWSYIQKAWQEILWRDSNLESNQPNDLPLSRHFEKLGWVVTRSGWNNSSDTFAVFQCGDFYAGHQHVDANSFAIHKGGSLAIDSGVNEYSSHRANYYGRTIAHNSILVFDPGENFSSAVWSAEGSGGSNDGGQLRGRMVDRVGKFTVGGPYDIADITQYVGNEHYTYICGDAVRAYSVDKVQWFTRQFVHIQPDVFVIFDRVVSKSASFRKAWLLHSIDRPAVDGNRVTIQQGHGKLVSHTILPGEHAIQLVGGPGKEYDVNGRNYPPDGKRDPESGSWRAEVSPAEPRTSDVFLHVLQTGLTDRFEDVIVSSIEEQSRTGVELRLHDLRARVLFTLNGQPDCSIRIERNSGILAEEIIGGR